jgi:hypothetical protein
MQEDKPLGIFCQRQAVVSKLSYFFVTYVKPEYGGLEVMRYWSNLDFGFRNAELGSGKKRKSQPKIPNRTLPTLHFLAGYEFASIFLIIFTLQLHKKC